MATMNIGSLVVDLIAESAQYIQGLQASNQATQSWSQQVSTSFSRTTRSIAGMAAGFLSVGAAMSAANAAMANAKEIENMARLANMSAEEFQAATYAVDQYGISAEKLGDISKDVADKLGDFISVEGGEFADFFDEVAPKVNLTAQELQGLSGPEVLIAVKKAMDDTNVSMEEQISYLEKISNDTALLIPLLENEGKAYRELTQEAHDLNLVIAQQDISNLREMDKALSQAGKTISTGFAQMVSGASEQIIWLSNFIADSARGWGIIFDSFSDNPKFLFNIERKIGETRKEIKDLSDDIVSYQKLVDKGYNYEDRIKKTKEEIAGLEKLEKDLVNKADEFNKRLSSINIPETQLQIDANEKADEFIKANDRILASVQKNLDTEQELLDKSYQQQIKDIEDLVLNATQLKATGYESMDAFRKEYLSRAEADYEAAQEQLKKRQQEDIQAEQNKNQQLLNSIQQSLGTEQELALNAYNQQVSVIESLALTQIQLESTKYQSMDELRRDYLGRAKEDYDKALAANQERARDEIRTEQEKNQQMLDSLIRSTSTQKELIEQNYVDQVNAVNSLVLEETAVRAAGYDTQEQLQIDLIQKLDANRKAELEQLKKNSGDTTDEMSAQMEKLAAAIGANTKTMEQATTSWANSFSTEFANMVTQGEMDFSRLAESIINDLIRIAIQANITKPLLDSMKLGGSGGDVGGDGVGPPAPSGLATGGPVMRGSTYLVGEQGPELFTASNSGSIIPNNRMGGNTTVNVYTQPGETAETRTRSTSQGDVVEIFMKQVDSRLNEQISRGQGLARTLEGRYSLNRKSY